MKNTLINNFCFLVFISMWSCSSQKPIYYQYKSEIETSINDVISKLKDSKFSIRNGDKSSKIFVLVDYEETKTSLIFNYYENMPESIQNQINRSNRFMILSGNEIPVIFYFDDGNSVLRINGTSHGIIGGYLIQFDNFGNVIMNGPVQ